MRSSSSCSTKGGCPCSHKEDAPHLIGSCVYVKVAKIRSFHFIVDISFLILLISCAGGAATLPCTYGHTNNFGRQQSDRSDMQVQEVPIFQDSQALMSLKVGLTLFNPHTSSLLSTWQENATDPCTWQAVQCTIVSNVSRVTSVNLSSSSLIGPIPAEISFLTALTSLSLNSNLFNGTIPLEIGSLSSLTYLDLSNNLLSGEIPASFSGLSNLLYLNLESNQLVGGIPEALFFMCGNLKILKISNNPSFGGELSPAFNSCKSLTVLDLEITNLQGSIPSELGQIPNLQYLNLGTNNLTGPLPDGLFSICAGLSYIDVSQNHLTGDVPASIGNCSALSKLMLCQNNFMSVPTELSQLTNLAWLLLGENRFVGDFPSQIASLTNLTILDLRANQFSGQLPSSLSELKSLEYLLLESNNFSGGLQPQLTSLSNLLYLDVSDNPLGGTIPVYFRNMTSMMFLILANCLYTGFIPPELGYLPNLQFLDLGDNQLRGEVPNTIGIFNNLLWLRLANNQLTGSIPDEIWNCSALIWLNLSNNSLTGPLPENIGFIGNTSVQTFLTNHDSLMYLPKQLGECNILLRWLPNLDYPYSELPAILDRDKCHIFWNHLMRGTNLNPVCEHHKPVASTGYIQLSMNMFNGSLPTSLSKTDHFNAFFMSNNNLSGNIPSVFNRIEISILQLQGNSFIGPIPSNFADMKCLEILNLSFNNLSGAIPTSLEHCSMLSSFNVSYNPLLSGNIPVGGQFLTFPKSSYKGDELLCNWSDVDNATNTGIPACKAPAPDYSNRQSPPQLPMSRKTMPTSARMVALILGCTLGALAICIGGFCLLGFAASRNSSSKYMQQVGIESDNYGVASTYMRFFSTELPKKLTHKDLLMATSNFDESNLIGDKGFGIVYKAKLANGTVVAIKKIHQEERAADHDVWAHISTLGYLQHENLSPPLGCYVCGNEVLLIHQYQLSAGSLDDWLHARPSGAKTLEWSLRLNIATGIARGLKFLHHSCSPAIVHGDIKASNILLDDNFEPKLTDFGLTQLLSGPKNGASTLVVANVGYNPPEYGRTGISSLKGDVYSFGVVLLELITGRRPMSVAYHKKSNIVEWVVALIKEGRAKDVFDPIVSSSGDPHEILQFLKLATWCTDETTFRRPTIKEVLEELEDTPFTKCLQKRPH